MTSKHAKIALVISFSLFLSACNKDTVTNNTVSSNMPETKQEESIKGKFSLKTLLSQNKSLVCTYKYQEPESEFDVSGTTYISGQRLYQETITTNTKDNTKSVKTNTLFLDSTIYTWSPDQRSQGMKIKVETDTQDQVKTDVAGAQETMEKEYDLDCQIWKTEDVVFKVPEDITFKDLSEMINNLPKMPNIPAVNP